MSVVSVSFKFFMYVCNVGNFTYVKMNNSRNVVFVGSEQLSLFGSSVAY